jgi:hypothetical protein
MKKKKTMMLTRRCRRSQLSHKVETRPTAQARCRRRRQRQPLQRRQRRWPWTAQWALRARVCVRTHSATSQASISRGERFRSSLSLRRIGAILPLASARPAS